MLLATQSHDFRRSPRITRSGYLLHILVQRGQGVVGIIQSVLHAMLPIGSLGDDHIDTDVDLSVGVDRVRWCHSFLSTL